jgi:hypothetical protein
METVPRTVGPSESVLRHRSAWMLDRSLATSPRTGRNGPPGGVPGESSVCRRRPAWSSSTMEDRLLITDDDPDGPALTSPSLARRSSAYCLRKIVEYEATSLRGAIPGGRISLLDIPVPIGDQNGELGSRCLMLACMRRIGEQAGPGRTRRRGLAGRRSDGNRTSPVVAILRVSAEKMT